MFSPALVSVGRCEMFQGTQRELYNLGLQPLGPDEAKKL